MNKSKFVITALQAALRQSIHVIEHLEAKTRIAGLPEDETANLSVQELIKILKYSEIANAQIQNESDANLIH